MSASILVVTAAAPSQALVTLADFKTEMGLSGTVDDAWIELKIAQASAAIASACRRVFVSQDYLETWRLDCVLSLRLSRYPVTAISAVTENGTIVAADDRELDGDAGLLWRLVDDVRTVWRTKIVVAYTAGYDAAADPDENPIPADLAGVCVSVVKRLWHQRTANPLVKSVAIPGVIDQEFWVGGVGNSGLFLPGEWAVLADYRRLDR